MSETPSLEDRIIFLEEQNEGMKRSGLLLVILVVIMGATMIYQSNSITSGLHTENLILNGRGKAQAALTVMPNGHMGFVFFDSQGNLPEVQHASIPYLDGFAIYDRNGVPRIHVGIDESGNPILATFTREGKVIFSATPQNGDGEAASQTQPAEPSPSPTVSASPTP